MIRSLSIRLLASAALIPAFACIARPAAAQASPLAESIVVGAWTFRPSVEVRIRGEYRRHPVDSGGVIYDANAVWAEAYKSNLPAIVGATPEVKNQWLVSERSRLGLAVDRGPATAAIVLQDARVWGNTDRAYTGPGQPLLPAFAPFEAYIDLHTTSRAIWFRAGRQRVTWGDGRLLGENDWSLTARSLDAARFGFQVSIVDVEMLAALLSAPGGLPPAAAGQKQPVGDGTGAQLYGLDVNVHILPLLNVEAMGLARIVREPHPTWLVPSNTFVIDGRIYGDRRGFRYALEGAYELGNVASYGASRPVSAFAFFGRASWETALPGRLTFGAEGAYATGDKGTGEGTQRRFDPILPNESTLLDPMSMVAWSNMLSAGGTIKVTPIDRQGLLTNSDRVELSMQAGYHFVNLAELEGRWTTASLVPVGAAPDNESRSLGHEIDVRFRFSPWKAIDFDYGYGLFLFGHGARAILLDAERPAKWQHWAYLQAIVHAP